MHCKHHALMDLYNSIGISSKIFLDIFHIIQSTSASSSPDGLNLDRGEHLLHSLVNVRDPNKPHPFLKLSELRGSTSNVQSSPGITRDSCHLRRESSVMSHEYKSCSATW